MDTNVCAYTCMLTSADKQLFKSPAGPQVQYIGISATNPSHAVCSHMLHILYRCQFLFDFIFENFENETTLTKIQSQTFG